MQWSLHTSPYRCASTVDLSTKRLPREEGQDSLFCSNQPENTLTKGALTLGCIQVTGNRMAEKTLCRRYHKNQVSGRSQGEADAPQWTCSLATTVKLKQKATNMRRGSKKDPNTGVIGLYQNYAPYSWLMTSVHSLFQNYKASQILLITPCYLFKVLGSAIFIEMGMQTSWPLWPSEYMLSLQWINQEISLVHTILL